MDIKKIREIETDINNIDIDVWKAIRSYPYSFRQIVSCELKAEEKLNNVFNPEKNPIGWWTCPDGTSTQWGLNYEIQFRHFMNKLGILHFTPGLQQTGEDLTCKEDTKYSIEHKTSQSTSFYNTNSAALIQKSTKYINPDEKHFYVFVRHNVIELENPDPEEFEYGPKQTFIESIRFGYLSKNDWKNPKGTGSAYLLETIKNHKTIEIWNRKDGFILDKYFGYLDNEYSILESEL